MRIDKEPCLSDNGINLFRSQDKIVQWLNTMRLGDGGFISTVDTIVAMEALVTYSYNSRIKDITDLTVEVDIPDSNLTHRSENHLLFTDLPGNPSRQMRG